MAKLYEIHPVVDVFPPMPKEQYEELRDDIDENGLLEPIWLSADDRIIDGRHRYRACLELGVEPEFQATEYEEEELLAIVVALNLKRRHLSQSQLAMVAARLKPMYEEAAKRRMESGKALEKGDLADPQAPVPEGQGQARDEAAERVGVSGRAVGYAEQVLKGGVPELKDAVDAGQISVKDAARAVPLPPKKQKAAVKRVQAKKAKHVKQALQQMRTEEQIKKIDEAPPVEGEYDVVVVDPAWEHTVRKDDTTQRGKTPYNQMTQEEIEAVEIPAKADCVLLCWCTNFHLVQGNVAKAIKAWGFEPKTLVTWVKNKMGNGDWARGKTEHFVVAVKGSPKLRKPFVTAFDAKVPRDHSRKPEEFYRMVEEHTVGTRGELFARRRRQGWYCHGVELSEDPVIRWGEMRRNRLSGRGAQGRLYEVKKGKHGWELTHTGNRGSKTGVGAGGSSPYAELEDAKAAAETHESAQAKHEEPSRKKRAPPKKKKARKGA